MATAAAAAVKDAHSLFAGAMPKSEIGALRYLDQHPDYDGRGVVVAIFDTGVDPSAAGLQVTTDGKPKILDVIDCTGSGDIDTSSIVKADSSGFITGASGRKLRVNPDWVNPSGEWHVGCRRLFELFPKLLQNRVKEQRKKPFDEAQRAAVADTAAALAATAADKDKGAPPIAAASTPAAAPASKSEFEARLKYLQDSFKNLEDPGPIVDVVVWHDGTTWRVALDTSDLYPDYNSSTPPPAAAADKASSGSSKDSSESSSSVSVVPGKQKGGLADFTPLADFKVEKKYGVFSHEDGCAYAVKVYDNGNTVSVVVDAGAHGTHVAGIVAAHFPEDPAANGMAPGAQIISCKIGDSRLGSMETGTGLVRALIAAMDAGVDIINMSYGEPAARPDVGRAIEVAAEAVHKAGIIFVASAGNAGPALSTVGAPGGTSSALLGIGAYVSPALAEAGHSLRKKLAHGQQYTWSSRGPTADGDIGVALSAPGGAIAPVPAWTLQKRQLMNGTSMASPCAAGGLALVLSGLKANGAKGPKGRITGSDDSPQQTAAAAAAASSKPPEQQQQQWISPNRIRRAVEATCKPLGGNAPDAVLTYGRGLLQVDAAFEYLMKSADVDLPDVRYDVTVSGGPGCSSGLGATRRGVYMRQPHEAAAAATYTVTVTPALHEDASVSDKLSVEEPLLLTSTASWVEAPDMLLLHHNGRTFEIKVDPTQLPPGLHYAEVQAINPDQSWRGPLFRVPITVVKPQDLLKTPDIDSAAAAAAAPAAAVEQPPTSFGTTGGPAAAAAAGLGFSSSGDSSSGVLPPHTLKLGPVTLSPGKEVRHFVSVPGGATWAEMSIRSGAYDTPKVFLIRATQLLPDVRYSDSELRSNLTLSPSSEWTTSFKVVGDATLELTLSQFWSSLGDSSIEVEVAFHGLTAEPVAGVVSVDGPSLAAGNGLILDGGAGPLKLMVHSPLRRQRIKPDAKLTHINWSLKPKDTEIKPLLDPRDCLPGGRVAYRLVITYGFNVTEAGKYTPCVPLTNRYLYDSPLESQLTQVFDSQQRLMYTGDAVPDEVSLSKGEHTARVVFRHDQMALLEKLKGTCLVLIRKLDSPVSVPVYTSQAAAVTSGTAASEAFLSAGDKAVLWLGPVPEDKLPKDVQGRTLEGTLSLGQLRRGSGAAPAATPFTYVPPPQAADGKKKDDPSSSSSGNGGKTKKTAKEQLTEAVRDAKISLLKQLKPADNSLNKDTSGDDDQQPSDDAARVAEALIAELTADWPKYIPLLLEILRRLDGSAKGDSRPAKLPAIIDAADAVISAIDIKELAAFTAMRPPADDDDDDDRQAVGTASAAKTSSSSSSSSSSATSSSRSSSYKEQKAEKDAEKSALLEALKAKLKAQLESFEAASGDEAAAAAATVAATAAQLRQWVDTAAEKDCLLLHARVEAAGGRYAAALIALDKIINPSDEVPGPLAPEASKIKQKLLEKLGWLHWKANEEELARVRFPSKLPPI